MLLATGKFASEAAKCKGSSDISLQVKNISLSFSDELHSEEKSIINPTYDIIPVPVPTIPVPGMVSLLEVKISERH